MLCLPHESDPGNRGPAGALPSAQTGIVPGCPPCPFLSPSHIASGSAGGSLAGPSWPYEEATPTSILKEPHLTVPTCSSRPCSGRFASSFHALCPKLKAQSSCAWSPQVPTEAPGYSWDLPLSLLQLILWDCGPFQREMGQEPAVPPSGPGSPSAPGPKHPPHKA